VRAWHQDVARALDEESIRAWKSPAADSRAPMGLVEAVAQLCGEGGAGAGVCDDTGAATATPRKKAGIDLRPRRVNADGSATVHDANDADAGLPF
jgi:hypothetical protein